MMLENNQSMVNLSEKLREIVVCFWIMQRWKLKILKLLKMYVFGVFPQIHVAIIITSTKCYSLNNKNCYWATHFYFKNIYKQMDGKVLTLCPYSYCEICLCSPKEQPYKACIRLRDTLYNCFTLLND